MFRAQTGRHEMQADQADSGGEILRIANFTLKASFSPSLFLEEKSIEG